MKETLEKLWNEYFFEECAVIDTDEERVLTRKAAKLKESANKLLSNDQKDAVEKYIDALCDINSLFVKKSFLKGCEFAVSFILETANFKDKGK